jgi:hypothetical protein
MSRKRKKAAPQNPSDWIGESVRVRHVDTVAMTIFEESDRGTVLVASAMIDESLGKVLRAHFMSVAGVTSEDMDFLFERQPLPPLGSLALKTRFAFCLGLISMEMRQAISAFRDVRNDFAHNPESMQLSARHIDSILQCFSEESREELLGVFTQLTDSLLKDASETKNPDDEQPTNPRHRSPSGPAILLAPIVSRLLGYLQMRLESLVEVIPTVPETPPVKPE